MVDSRVNGSQVRVYAEPGNTRDEATVRIRSTVPVDEPVVNIYLKVGCGQAMTRKYVLLAQDPCGLHGAVRGAPTPRPASSDRTRCE